MSNVRLPLVSRRHACKLLAGVVLPTALSLTGCGIAARGAARAIDSGHHEGATGRYGRLTAQESVWAKAAWRYFENNINASTGLPNSIDRYPTMTMWHLGDFLAALVAARELDLITQQNFDLRLARVLSFLNTMALSGGIAPNKAYNALNGVMINFTNQPEDIGWSALDLGRLLVWMKIVGQLYPHFQEYLDKAMLRWSFCSLIDDCGTLYSSRRSKGQLQPYAEGRLGYEQYASSGFASWGFNIDRARTLGPYDVANINGLQLRYDARDARVTGIQSPVLTMPHVLLGLEFDWRLPGNSDAAAERQLRSLAQDVYLVQQRRYQQDGIVTARTDHQLKQPPYFLYDSIFAAGYPWSTLSEQGKDYRQLALVSTRAAFGLWALWNEPYTDTLLRTVDSLYDPQLGWYEGRYESSGAIEFITTLSTNATVLECLLFKVRGTLFASESATPGFLQKQMDDVFARPKKCLAPERQSCGTGEK
jgi:Protein of unknown function (DUF3131)